MFFHALTGSDITSFFKGIGKKKAWEAWNVMPDITPIFAQLVGSNGVNSTIPARDFKYLQHFVCVMYSKNSPHVKLNGARHATIVEGVAIKHIPPTEGALMQKAKRALLQNIFWHSALDLCPPKPPAQNFSWKKVNGK